MTDTEIVDFLSRNHVHVTYYDTPAVEISWFIRRKTKKCPTCKHEPMKGHYPSFRGKDLRSAMKALEEDKEYNTPEEVLFLVTVLW